MFLSKFLKFELIKTDQLKWILLTDPKLSNNDVFPWKLDLNFAERTAFNINVYKSTWDVSNLSVIYINIFVTWSGSEDVYFYPVVSIFQFSGKK